MEGLVGKRIFLTGHTGFKGRWLAEWLKRRRAGVCGYSLPTNDVRNFESLLSYAGEYQPDIILHFAAQAVVRTGYDDPLGTYSTNVMGTANILEVARRLGVPVLVVTSDKCYEEAASPRVETDRLGGYDPYSSSKAAAELLCNTYRSSYGIQVVSVRAGNCIGGGDRSKDRLIPDCIRSLQNGRSIILRNPEALRPWQHVLDPLNGYLMLVERMLVDTDFVGTWNFGPDTTHKVHEVVETLIKLWGKGQWVYNTDVQPHESQILLLDSSKAKTTLGWKPKWDIEQTLFETVKWYRIPLPSQATNITIDSYERFKSG